MAHADGPGITSTQRWLGFALLLLGTFMGMLDIFIVNVAGPSIQTHLDADFGDLQRVIAAYDVAYAAALVTGGRLGDICGPRRMFLIGTVVFAITSLACALAPDAGFLVATRGLQGLAAAIMLPQVLSLIQLVFSGTERVRAIGWYSASIGVAAIAGQVIGGVLLAWNPADLGWRSIFVVNLPISIVAFFGVLIFVREPGQSRRRHLDLGGTLLLGLALSALLYPLSGGPVVLLLAAAALLLAFWWHEQRLIRRNGDAVFPFALLRVPSFAGGLVTALLFYGCNAGFAFVLAYHLQKTIGLLPLEAGLIFAPMASASMAGSLLSARLASLLGTRTAVAAGGVAAAGLLLIAVTGESPLGLMPGLIIYGFAGGLIAASLVNLPLHDVSAQDVGGASGTLLTVTQAANAIGLTGAGALFAAGRAGARPDTAFTVTLGVLAVGFLVLVPMLRGLVRSPATFPSAAPPH